MAAADDAYAQLCHRVVTTQVPTAPPRYPYMGTSVGVGLLDAAINLDHMVRRSERLKVVDLTHLSREVTLHLSLDRLTPPQYAASREYGEMRERVSPDGEKRAMVWVPVTRVNRLFAAPVRIFDNEGREVPRATQPELLPFINAAMYRLLRLVLVAQSESEPAGSTLHRLLFGPPHARWLLQKAVANMIYDTYHVNDPKDPCAAPTGTSLAAPTRDALSVVRTHLTAEKQAAFLDLLYRASTQYLVLAGLPANKKEHYLSYSAATLPTGQWVRGIRGLWRGLSLRGAEFTLRYRTPLPSNLESFHVTVEVDEQALVREALLVTSHDRGRCSSLLTCLRSLRLRPNQALPLPICRYEIGAALLDLEVLVQDRVNDADGYRRQWELSGQRTGTGLDRSIPRAGLRELMVDLEVIGQDRLRAGLHEPELDLATLPERIEELDLGCCVVTDDDPRGHVAHMYWHRRRPGTRSVASGHAIADVQVVVGDLPSPLTRSITAWLVVLMTLVGTMATLLYGSGEWLTKVPLLTAEADSPAIVDDPRELGTDALVAVLLIVPGWLLARLGGFPVTRSLAARLRALESLTALLAIAATAYLALVIAGRANDRVLLHRSFWGTVTALGVLLLATMVERHAKAKKSQRTRVELLDHPGWLSTPQSRVRNPLRSHPRAFDAEFESVAHWATGEVVDRVTGKSGPSRRERPKVPSSWRRGGRGRRSR